MGEASVDNVNVAALAFYGSLALLVLSVGWLLTRLGGKK